MADRDAEVLLDGLDRELRPAVRESRVDLGVTVAGDVDPQVAREGHEHTGLLAGVDVRHHHRVGALTGLAARAAEVLGVDLALDERTRVGADEQVVAALRQQSGRERHRADLRDLLVDHVPHGHPEGADKDAADDERNEHSLRERAQ